MSSVIAVKNLVFAYPSVPEKTILEIDDLQIEPGEHVFLYGPSGSGKSTLLHLFTGLASATNGQVSVLDHDWQALTGRKRDRFRAQHIGFVFQQLNLIPYLTVLDNILLGNYFSPTALETKVAEQKATFLLSELKLPESVLHQQASQLSVGQQQRVAIARALINDPEVLIADEPTSSLDQSSRDAFVELLFTLAKNHNSTLVFVSHDQTLAKHFHKKIDLEDINKVAKEEN